MNALTVVCRVRAGRCYAGSLALAGGRRPWSCSARPPVAGASTRPSASGAGRSRAAPSRRSVGRRSRRRRSTQAAGTRLLRTARGRRGRRSARCLQNGACPNVFFSEDMRSCFGYMNRIGRVSVSPLRGPVVVPDRLRSRHSTGRTRQPDRQRGGRRGGPVARWAARLGHNVVQGDFARREFDVTPLLRAGENSLAIEVTSERPVKDAYAG